MWPSLEASGKFDFLEGDFSFHVFGHESANLLALVLAQILTFVITLALTLALALGSGSGWPWLCQGGRLFWFSLNFEFWL